LWGNLGNAASVARLKIIAGCAHVPQLQSPEVFLEAIGDFLPAAQQAKPGIPEQAHNPSL
jgi:pimeloyl-ACP methyl ester carboxylesterase